MLVHAISLGLLGMLLIDGHPVHRTVAEVQWNDESKLLEVALRLDGLDEQWILRNLSTTTGRQKTETKLVTPSSGHQQADSTASERNYLHYLRSHFRINENSDEQHRNLTTKDHQHAVSRQVIYRWIGRKEDGAHVWWFFELVPASGQRPSFVENTILLDRHSSYVNQIRFLGYNRPGGGVANQASPRVRFPSNSSVDAVPSGTPATNDPPQR